MKKLKILIYFLLGGAFIGSMFLYDLHLTCETTTETDHSPGRKEFLQLKGMVDPHAHPAEWMARQRMYPHNRIKSEYYLAGLREAQKQHANSPVRYQWEEAGPENIGGRITDIEVNPQNTDVIYVGAASGGILKTEDGGLSWVNVFGDQPVITIGDLALDPGNPDILYAGTGEANVSSFSFIGDGVHKSTDGGQTWEHLGLENSAYIGRIVVDHDDSNRMFVAASGNLFSTNSERGIYRTIDGGQNWERILFLTDSTAAIDIVQHPQNPDILIAAMWERVRGLNYRRSFGNSSGLWKTTDGGDNWYELTNGLPTGNDVGRIGVDIAKSDPNVVYAFYDRQNSVKVYKSSDMGESWTSTNDGAIQGMNSSFGWYFGQIRIDPTDHDTFYIMGVELYKSSTGGNSYTALAGYWNISDIYVDHHAMWIDPATGRIFEGNDGGFYISDNGGNSWTKINNLPITQFYHIEIDYLNPQRLYGGTQDNNTIRTLSGSLTDWQRILGGDGMYTQIDYTNSNIIYAESQWGNIFRSFDLGNSFSYIGDAFAGDRKNWSSPFQLHPENPTILYFGSYRLWKGTGYGDSWTAISPDLTKGDDGTTFHTLTTLDISRLNPQYIITGSDDGLVHITTNEGATWQDISQGLPDRWITSVVFDPFDSNTIYATVSGFRWDEPSPHVFKSTNLGQDWINISGNLPDIPVNEIECDPDFQGRHFVATDAGVFMTYNDGQDWAGLSAGMPLSPAVSLQIHAPTRDLVVGTYGNSCFRVNLDDIMVGFEGSESFKNLSADLMVVPGLVSAEATARITVAQNVNARITLFDSNGRPVEVIFAGELTHGQNDIPFNIQSGKLANLPAGLYFCSLSFEGFSKTEKFIIIR
jgi:photosystem II stability/assembly factor-like uncharacterized protein